MRHHVCVERNLDGISLLTKAALERTVVGVAPHVPLQDLLRAEAAIALRADIATFFRV